MTSFIENVSPDVFAKYFKRVEEPVKKEDEKKDTFLTCDNFEPENFLGLANIYKDMGFTEDEILLELRKCQKK